jgi:hypothetical protein
MPTYTKKQQYARRLTGAPYGDMIAISDFNLTTNASGVPADADAGSTALVVNDIIRLGILPAGLRLLDYIGVISDAFTASSTHDLGFAYVDGVDSTAVPQNAAYFASGVSLASTAVQRKTTITPPVTLPKDAYLILTNKGANQAAVGVLDITVIGQAVGPV